MTMWPFKRKKHPLEVEAEQIKGEFDRYREWAAKQVCQGCGKGQGDETAGCLMADGTRAWVTEDWCGCKLGAKVYVDRRPRF